MNAAISGRAYDLPGTPMNNKSVWSYLAEIIPILTAIIGGLWTLNLYLDQREKNQRAMSESARKEQETRLLEAQKPFLVKQLDLYFETASLVGKLVTTDPSEPNWKDLERKYWALYWSELSMVEHRVVEEAMKKFGDALTAYSKDQNDANKRALQSAAYHLAHAIRSGIEHVWGTTATGTGVATSR